MESQEKEKEYERSVWEIYRKEWETASPEKKTELNKRMRRWQELIKSGLTAQQAYIRVMEGEPEKSPIYTLIEEESDYRVTEHPLDRRPAIPSTPRTSRAPLILLSLALAVVVVYSVIVTVGRNALNTELDSVQTELTARQAELVVTKQTLVTIENQLTAAQAELDPIKVELRSTQKKLSSRQIELSLVKETLDLKKSELSSMEQTLASTQSELGSLNNILTSVQDELEAAEAKVMLFQETFGADVFSGEQPQVTGGGFVGSPNLKNNPTATNPSWGQLKSFLLFDPTDDETYSEYTFNCVSFAEMLHNNAEDAGIKAAFVAMFFEGDEVGHTLNAFTTTDKGLVYVDCTSYDPLALSFEERLYIKSHPPEYDSIASALKGEEYRRWSIDEYTFWDYRYYEPYRQTSDWERYGLVESIIIYW